MCAFVEELRQQLREVCNGSVSIIVQDGHVIQLNVQQHYNCFPIPSQKGNVETSNIDDSDDVVLNDEDFSTLLQYLEQVKYGSVILIIESSKVVGIEKNEKLKLK
ncbi:MAG: YezD family protein [Fusobacteriaceae bacterium]|jgi:hypothetical protein|nr:YezD family protein [Fusobacteriaceae bacterium]